MQIARVVLLLLVVMGFNEVIKSQMQLISDEGIVTEKAFNQKFWS